MPHVPARRRRAILAVLAATTLAVAGPVSIPAAQAGPTLPTTFTLQGPAGITGGQVEGLGAQNNPVAGAVKAVVPHPTDPNVMWVGSVNGGVWRTTNATSATPTWTPLTDTQSSLSVGALDLDPTFPTNLVLVAGFGRWSSLGRTGGALNGILRTTDGGATWSTLGTATLSGEDISGVAARGSTILVTSKGGLGGVWRSTDTGATFTRLSGNGTSGLPGGSVFDIAGDPLTAGRLYVVVAGAGGGVFRSDDTGATWTALGGGTFGGASATNITTALDNAKLAAHNDGTTASVYAAVDNGGQLVGLLRSVDAGANWTALDRPQTIEGGTPVGLQPQEDEDEEGPGGQGGIHLSMTADPTNPAVVYLGGDRQPQGAGADGVFGTNDDSFPNSIGANNFSGRSFRCDATLAAGAQCTPLTHSGTAGNTAPHADSRDMAFDAAGNLIESDDGGVYRRSSPANASGDWSSVIGNLAVSESHSCDYDHVAHVSLCGDQDTGVPEQPSTGATTWREVSQADGGIVAVDDVAAPSTRYHSNQNLGGFTRRSCDAANNCSSAAPSLNVAGTGQTLRQVDTNIQFYNPIAVNDVAAGRLIIATNTVYESTDRGDNLTRLTGFTGSATRAIAYGGRTGGVDNPDVLFVGSSSGLFLRSAAGTTVTRLTTYPGGPPTGISLDPANWLSAWVVDNNTVWHTPDGGTTWTDITGDLATQGGQTFRSVAFIPGTTASLVAVATSTGVFATQSQQLGKWGKMTGALPNAVVFGLRYDVTDDVLIVATLGRSAWTVSQPATVLPTADLTVSKVARPDPAVAGQNLSYDVTVTNHGPGTALNVELTDTLPAQVDYLSDNAGCTNLGQTVTCALGDLPNGASRTVTITTLVHVDAVAGSSSGTGQLKNTATVGSVSLDPNLSDNTTTISTLVQDKADLAVTKLCQPDVALKAGETGTCTIFVDNFGPSLARDVTVTDTHVSNGGFTFGTITPSQGSCDPPASGLITCHLGNLGPATPSATGRATVTIQLTATEAQTIDDTAKAVAATPDPDVTNNSAHDTISISASADLRLVKTGPASVTAGTTATFTLTATNLGPSTATGVTIADALPAGVTVVSVGGSGCTAGTPGDPGAPARCAIGTLAPGGSGTMTVVVRVDPDTTGILHDDGGVDSDAFDPNTANNLTHVDTTVTTSADLGLTVAATPNPVTAGNSISYELTIANTGPSVARNVTLTDPVPSPVNVTSLAVSSPAASCDLRVNTNTVQCQAGDLAPGRSVVITVYGTVAASTPAGPLTDTASVTSSTADPVPANNSASVTTQVITRADLGIALTSDKDVYKPSTVIHYTITVTNGGPSDAQAVTTTQVLPDPKMAQYVSNDAGCAAPAGTTFTCALGTIPAGGSRSYQLNILIRGNKGTISQTATVTSTTVDPNTGNNSSIRNVTVK